MIAILGTCLVSSAVGFFNGYLYRTIVQMKKSRLRKSDSLGA